MARKSTYAQPAAEAALYRIKYGLIIKVACLPRDDNSAFGEKRSTHSKINDRSSVIKDVINYL